MAPTAAADAMPAPQAARADESVGRGRMVIAWVLVGTATLIAVLAVLATWVNRQMLSDSSWETASTRLIQDPEVQAAVANYVVTQIYENVDVAAEIRQALPPQLKPFAGPLAGALVKPSTQAVSRLLTRPRVQKLWINASVGAHTRLVNVLENKTGKGIDAGNGTVTLDLRPIIGSVAAQVGVPAAAVANLPP